MDVDRLVWIDGRVVQQCKSDLVDYEWADLWQMR